MTVSDFTQENSAMLLIDHQVGTMKLIKNLPLTEVEKNTLALAKVAKVLKVSIAELVEEVPDNALEDLAE